jgi:hypothetical protein
LKHFKLNTHESLDEKIICGHGGGKEIAAIAWSWMALKQIWLKLDV